MTATLTILLKITMVIFMVGNLLDLGLRLNLKEAVRGLRDVRFVTLSVPGPLSSARPWPACCLWLFP